MRCSWLVLGVLAGVGCAEPVRRGWSPPLPDADGFPIGPLERVCGGVGLHFVRMPEERLGDVTHDLHDLDTDALSHRTCTTATRQEASVGLTLLAERRDDRQLLVEIAETWGEPLALAVLARDEAGDGFPLNATRHAAAAREVSRGITQRSRSAPRLVLATLPELEERPTERDERYAEEKAATYERLFATPHAVLRARAVATR